MDSRRPFFSRNVDGPINRHRGISLLAQYHLSLSLNEYSPGAIVIVIPMTGKTFWALAGRSGCTTWMDELFLRNEHNPRGISPLANRARKRAQGSRRLCNRDYAARTWKSIARCAHDLLPCGCPRAFEYQRRWQLQYYAAMESYAKIMRKLYVDYITRE